MTLIAYTVNKEIPFLIGDILISATGLEKGIQLPTNDFDITDYLITTEELKPFELRQKIYIISERVSIAFSGGVKQMTIFLKEFRLRCSYYDNTGGITKEAISEFLNEYDLKNSMNDASFLIIHMELYSEEE